MKRRMCDLSDEDDGRSTNLENLLEKLIDSVLLMGNKVEGLSSRVDKLEEKLNEEILLGRNERDEFMNEVKSELAKLKKSQEEERTVHVDPRLVSKLSNLRNENDLHVGIASTSEGWRTWRTSHLDVQQTNRENLDLDSWDSPWNFPLPKRQKAVENELRMDLASCSEGRRTSYLDTQHLNHRSRDPGSWDKHLKEQQNEKVDSPWKLSTQPKLPKSIDNELPVDMACAGEGWRPWSPSPSDLQQPNHGNRDLNSWDKPFNVHQLNHLNEYYSSHWNMDSNSWDKPFNVHQPNQVDCPWSSLQPKRQKPVESKLPEDIASGTEGWRTSTSHLDVQQKNE